MDSSATSQALFRVKICGVGSAKDARQAVEFGADAIGFNFYQRSLRCLDADVARQIAAELPDTICRVGVFVNSSAEEIERVMTASGLTAVQLHGDERPELVTRLSRWPVIRAMRVPRGIAVQEALRRAQPWIDAGIAAVLWDALAADGYGGTGRLADWSLAEALRRSISVPLVLAGGLTPGNVGQAIRVVHPAAVDTASGVELLAGKKDENLMRQFVEASRKSFDEMTTEDP